MEQAVQVIENEEMEDYEEADLQWYYNEVIVESKRKWSPRNRRALTILNAISVLAIWLYGLVQEYYIGWKRNPTTYRLMLVDYTSSNLLGIYSWFGVHPKHPTRVDLRWYRSYLQASIMIRIVCTAVFVYIVVAEGNEDLYTFSSAATAVAMIGVVTIIYPMPFGYPIDRSTKAG